MQESNYLKKKKEEIAELQKQYEECLRIAKRNIELIKQGKKFGYPDGFEEYFPLELVEIVNEEECLIKVYEPSIKEYSITSTYGLHVEK